MASFGASDKSSDKKVVNMPQVGQGLPAAAYGYPNPSAPYVSAQSASPFTQAGTYPGFQAAAAAAAYGYHQGPPPPYSVAVSQPAAVPGYYTYPQLAGYPYGYATPTQAGLMYPGTTYVVPGAYDAGARFDGIARQTIPYFSDVQPVPPGVAPNAAQLAMMQGGTVMMTQQKSSEGGGFTFW